MVWINYACINCVSFFYTMFLNNFDYHGPVHFTSFNMILWLDMCDTFNLTWFTQGQWWFPTMWFFICPTRFAMKPQNVLILLTAINWIAPVCIIPAPGIQRLKGWIADMNFTDVCVKFFFCFESNITTRTLIWMIFFYMSC